MLRKPFTFRFSTLSLAISPLTEPFSSEVVIDNFFGFSFSIGLKKMERERSEKLKKKAELEKAEKEKSDKVKKFNSFASVAHIRLFLEYETLISSCNFFVPNSTSAVSYLSRLIG